MIAGDLGSILPRVPAMIVRAGSDAVPDEHLEALFKAADADVDSAGAIDAGRLGEFLCSDPLGEDMSYDVFAESMLQRAARHLGRAAFPDDVSAATVGVGCDCCRL